MKNLLRYKSYIVALAALLMLAACSKEDPFPDGEGKMCQVSLAKFKVEAINKENVIESTRAGEDVNVDDFTVEIRRGSSVVRSFRYGDMPSVIDLQEGDYTAVAYYGDKNAPQGWDAPYFEGSEQFAVSADKVNEVEPINAVFSSVKVTILYDEVLLAAMSEDSKVNVVVGENGSLDFMKGETRSGYFAYVEDSPSLVARFEGSIEGIKESMTKTHNDVRPGNHYKITFRLRTPGTTGVGTVSEPDLQVDATVTVEDLTMSVDYDDDILTDDKRPGEEEPDQPNPPVSEGGPTVTAEAPINLDIFNEVYPDLHCVLNVDSESGITAFTVDIQSQTLTPEVLTGVGLGDHLDLVNPGSLESGIRDLDLPCKEQVLNQKHVVFDVSGFMSLLGIYGAADHLFILTVTDASGTTTKTLKLRTL